MKFRIYNGQQVVTEFEAADRETALEKALGWSGLSLHEIEETSELYEVLCEEGHLCNNQETTERKLRDGTWTCPVCKAKAYSWDTEDEEDDE